MTLLFQHCLECKLKGSVLFTTKLPIEGREKTSHKLGSFGQLTELILKRPEELLQPDL